VGDKSIEALALIEEKILGRPVDRKEKLYMHFLDPVRLEGVKQKEELFWKMNARS
jgi:hypothetical protein